jgi:hypothetical protein
MRPPQPEGAPPLEISMEELETLVEQARAVLPEDGYKKLLGAVRTLRYVTELLEKKEASLADLRELLCPATTEKTEKVRVLSARVRRPAENWDEGLSVLFRPLFHS